MTRILLTNDDGVGADGLEGVRSAMLDAGLEVVVVAPDGNRSAMAHRVIVREPIEMRRIEDPRGEVWACSGTSVDCVRLGYFHSRDVGRPVDAVVSGINHGVNLGEDVYYSGTVAAAIEAALLGLPAIAASQAGSVNPTGFLSERPAAFPYARYVARAAGALAGVPGIEGVAINLNFPDRLADPAVRYAGLGSRDWTTSGIRWNEQGDGIVVEQPWAADPVPIPIPGSDFDLVGRGHVTATPLSVRGGIAADPEAWERVVAAGFPVDVRDATVPDVDRPVPEPKEANRP